MTWRRDRDGGETGSDETRGGLTGLLRSLLSGIPWSERAEEETTLRVAAPPSGVFRLHNSNGRTRVTGEDRDDIEVRAHKCARAESAEAAGQLLREIHLEISETPQSVDLEVEVPRKWNRRGSANLCVKVPRQMQVAVSAANGRIDVEGIRGLVSARSSNGSANVTDVVGDVEVATSNAKVTCKGIRGKLTARSSNGKIEIGRHRGSVDASTSNGLIRAGVEEVGKEGVALATSNGRIVLELPEDVDVDVDMRVDNGIIRNDRAFDQTSRDSNGRLVGRLGHGGVLVKLRTSNGSISLF